jgi:vacuolar protein sorting-associated protein 13A/C
MFFFFQFFSSGVIWEEKKRKRFKALKLKHSQAIEAAWINFNEQLSVGNKVPARVEINPKLIVEFAPEAMMIKPHKCPIRRSFEHGIWIQYRVSPHQMQLHLKLHRLQVSRLLAAFSSPPPLSFSA